jgi:putative acetyltransferase
MGWTFHENELDSADVQGLLALHVAAMRACSPPGACHVLPPENLRAADIRFFSVREAGRLLGIGALKRLAADHCEIKSMRTAPEALGRGVGLAMLRHLMDEVRRGGCARLSLETGTGEAFTAALALYAGAGFVPCGPFGGYAETPFTRFFTRAL